MTKIGVCKWGRPGPLHLPEIKGPKALRSAAGAVNQKDSENGLGELLESAAALRTKVVGLFAVRRASEVAQKVTRDVNSGVGKGAAYIRMARQKNDLLGDSIMLKKVPCTSEWPARSRFHHVGTHALRRLLPLALGFAAASQGTWTVTGGWRWRFIRCTLPVSPEPSCKMAWPRPVHPLRRERSWRGPGVPAERRRPSVCDQRTVS